MFDPVSLGVGVGMNVLGGLMGRSDAASMAKDKAIARNAALTRSLEKQAQYAAENRGNFDTRMTDYAPGAQDKALTGAQDARTATSIGAITAPTDASEMGFSKSAPDVVRSEYAKRMLGAYQYATDRAKASGKLGGYGDTWLDNNVGIADTGRRIGTVNNFSQAENAMLPAQMDLAEQSVTRRPSMWGPILQTGGMLLAGSGARGGLSSMFGSGNLGEVGGGVLGNFKAGL